MPYYQWRGVDIQANIQKGALFAQSADQLADKLLKKEIYLLNAQPKNYRFILRRITQVDLTDFFHHLATLLEAKVHLYDALPLVIEQSDNPKLQNVLYTVADSVNNGIAFHKALQLYPRYFPPFVLQVIAVGQESGTINLSCRAVAMHMQEQSVLYHKIRAALLLPGVTFVCFIAIVIIIFTALIPRFAITFDALKIPLPRSTQMLLSISSWFTLAGALGLLSMMIALTVLVLALARFNRCRLFFSSIMLYVPFIGPLIHYRFCASFFQSLATLLEHTISLDSAMKLLSESEKNKFFNHEITTVQKAVHAGIPLHTALARSRSNLFSNAIIAMMSIGEESGNLVFMLNKITEFYTKMIQRRLYIITTLIQPILMVFLGLCIALLITFLYVPLFNLSLSIGNP